MAKFLNYFQTPTGKKWLKAFVITVVIVGLYLIFCTDLAYAGMDDNKIKKMVDDKLGSGSFGQKVLGGAGLVTTGIMAYTGQLKIAVITLLSTGGILAAYNSGILF